MIDETGTGAAGAGTGGDSGAVASTAGMSDEQILDSPATAGAADGAAGGGAATGVEATTDAAAAANADPNAAAAVDDAPAWLKALTDPTMLADAKTQWEQAKLYREAFPDAASAKAIAEQLPGGKEQLEQLITTHKQIEAQDAALASNDLAQIGPVVGEFLSGENAPTIFRAGAAHLAEKNPEAWAQLSGELLTSTLQADGMTDALAGLADAIKNEDSEYVGKFLTQAAQWAEKRGFGGKAGARQENPDAARWKKEADTAKAATQELKTQGWNNTRQSAYVAPIQKEMGTAIDGKLADVLPEGTPAALKTRLTGEINEEIASVMNANAYLEKQIMALIGHPNKPRLEATEADWKKASELATNAAKAAVPKAAAKVLDAWTEMAVLKGNKTAAAAAAAGSKTEVGSQGGSKTKKTPTQAELRGMTDEEILDM